MKLWLRLWRSLLSHSVPKFRRHSEMFESPMELRGRQRVFLPPLSQEQHARHFSKCACSHVTRSRSTERGTCPLSNHNNPFKPVQHRRSNATELRLSIQRNCSFYALILYIVCISVIYASLPRFHALSTTRYQLLPLNTLPFHKQARNSCQTSHGDREDESSRDSLIVGYQHAWKLLWR